MNRAVLLCESKYLKGLPPRYTFIEFESDSALSVC